MPASIDAPTDLNGDGRSDFLWRNESSGDVFMMLMNGLAIGAVTGARARETGG